MDKIKSVNLMVTSLCNSHCNMCGIWKSGDNRELDSHRVIDLFNDPRLSEVEDLSISGGEPFLKKDLVDFSRELIRVNPKLKMLFVNTNGLMPDKAFELAEYLLSESAKINPTLQIFFSISIEGPKSIHEKIRGTSYDTSVSAIKKLSVLFGERFKVMVSMTIQRQNADFIEEVRAWAMAMGCNYSFRFADFTDNYYQNSSSKDVALNREECILVMDRVKPLFENDEFFKTLYQHICFRKDDLMLNKNGDLICQAGKIFIFIKSDGKIYPCIYSNQVIGDLNNGLQPFSLKRLENCPCCTECHIYPMLIYSKK